MHAIEEQQFKLTCDIKSREVQDDNNKKNLECIDDEEIKIANMTQTREIWDVTNTSVINKVLENSIKGESTTIRNQANSTGALNHDLVHR